MAARLLEINLLSGEKCGVGQCSSSVAKHVS